MTRETNERRRAELEEELTYQLGRLDTYVECQDRRPKIRQAIEAVTTWMEKITAINEQLLDDVTDDNQNADKQWMDTVQEKVSISIDAAKLYIEGGASADIKSQSERSVRTSSTAMRKLHLSAQIEEQQRQAEADIKIRQAEADMKKRQEADIKIRQAEADIELIKVAESHRQKRQALIDESNALDEENVSLSSKSEKSLKQRNVVVEHPTSTSLVTTWLDKHDDTPVFEIPASQADDIQQSSAALPPRVIPSTAVPGTQHVVPLIPPSSAVLSMLPADYAHYALPKWDLKTFEGHPLQWPEWSGMFKSTVTRSPITNDQKMNHLKSLVTGRAKIAIAGLPYDGAYFDKAWEILERKFGRPHVIISAQLDKIQNYPSVRMHNSSSLIDFSTAVSNLICIFEQLGYTNDLCSASNLQLLVSKLPPNLKEKWFGYITSRCWDTPSIKEFDTWLQKIADTHERLLGASVSTGERNFQSQKTQRVGTFATNSSTQSPTCSGCKGKHRLIDCDAFKKKTPTDRAIFLKQNSLCFCCLNFGHSFRKCTFAKPCGIDGCTKTHHHLIHGANQVYQPHPPQGTPRNVVTATLSTPLASNRGFLQIVPILVHGETSSRSTFALCDLGSTHSWVDREFATLLGLKKNPVQIVVNSIQDSHIVDTSLTSFSVSSVLHSARHEVKAYEKDCLVLGNDSIDVKSLKQKYEHLSPISSNLLQFGDVKVLLGQDVFSLIRPLEYRYADNKLPWAVRLPLGWVLSGPVPELLRENCTSHCYHVSVEDTSLSNQVKRWLDIESYATTVQVDARSSDDRRAMNLLESSTTHNGSRYKMGLLWNKDSMMLPNNYRVAYSQLLSLERRLNKQPELKSLYAASIKTDIDKDYVREVKKAELQSTRNANQWYLPHHPVVNPNKPGKIRRVCNAASKYMGTSLNDALLTGPDLLNNLVGIILRFRQYPIAITADVEAMFLQVEVTEADQRVLRFLWREDSNEEVKVFQYTRHVFGAKDSPTCANYALRRSGIDKKLMFPKAADAVLKDFYMDDFIKSVETSEQAIVLRKQLCEILLEGGFNLTKWGSNSKEVVESIPAEISSSSKDTSMHVLGIKWDISADTLAVSRGLDGKMPPAPTQRDILKFASSVFDPVGFIAPFTITARLILKQIWRTVGQCWDEPVSNEHRDQFANWVKELASLQTITVPRVYFTGSPLKLQLHVFGDASLEAMCVVAYLLGTFNEDEPPQIVFLMGKCRVAPMKQMTIPKLELQASLIAARLKIFVLSELELKITSCIMWTDSSTALQWIQSSHKKQPIFVANRVAEILEHSTVDEWRHVPGSLNPADCGTRTGLSPIELQSREWLNGPAFLKQPESQWPVFVQQIPDTDEAPLVVTSNVVTINQPIVSWQQFSQFKRLVCVVARILRLRLPKATRGGPLGAADIKNAQLLVLKLSQQEAFSKEFKLLSCEKQLPTSVVSQLSPFIDMCGIIRAKGRTRKAPSLSYSAKHPIILDSRHPAVKLFLLQVHAQHHHQGVEYQRSIINQEFWILHLRSALRAIKNNCVTCRRNSAAAMTPEMADLPAERLLDRCFPFSSCGIDYFGPLEVRIGRKQHAKRWVCLITCLSTRAIHLELCYSLSADSCILALQRFIARRGRPKNILSDNGTNFVGCHNELKSLVDVWNSHCVQSYLTMEQIQWKFNPPASPHFGGVWERMVRSSKKAMYTILGSRRLSDELLLTVLCQVEQILNSRPLVPVSSDVEDLEALTPNHFLLGRASICLPLFDAPSNDSPCYRRFYRNAEIYTNWIWSRWLVEYVPSLNVRKKWHHDNEPSVSVGDLVWIVDPTTPRGYYPLARIIKLNFGDDGVARSAAIKTKTGDYVRPLAKLVSVFNICP